MSDKKQEWPPRSPLKTLLSSPSGRKKYQAYQDSGAKTSPNKLLGSPSLLEKLRAARANRDQEILHQVDSADGEENDDDEEILQLKLQAIEARLKLKKLQQQKAKTSENLPSESTDAPVSDVLVALSPRKQVAVNSGPQKSPSRILLGIDKGISAEDVSLRRAKTVHGSPTRRTVHHVESRLARPATSRSSVAASSPAPAKSFSERMAEMRDRERKREDKRSAALNSRSSSFKIDKQEVAGYLDAVGTNASYLPRGAPPRSQIGLDADSAARSGHLKPSESMPNVRHSSSTKTASESAIESATTNAQAAANGDPALFEGFSCTHLSSRILPQSFLKRTLPTSQFTIYTLPSLLKTVTSPSYTLPDEVVDHVVFGIIASKSSPLTHKRQAGDNTTSSSDWQKKWDDGTANRSKFIVLKLTDLKWTLDLYLFETAVTRYHRLTPGKLIAVLNPGIMPPKKGKEDTGAFSLSLHDGEDRVLEIGTARHLGHCSARKKDGSICGDWVDSSKTEICEYHLSISLDKVRSGRSGINSMSGFGGQGKGSVKNGYDAYSQSRYYAIGGTAPKTKLDDRWSFAPTHNASLSTAKLLDMGPGDDPFVAEGQMLQRDKQDRLRRRMEMMQKEHEIAKRLAKIGGSAGAEYMKHRTRDTTKKPNLGGNEDNHSGITKEDILAPLKDGTKKRAADSVRLSPVKKKTRFVTDQGIKVAGRESMGSNGAQLDVLKVGRASSSDDESDLDIV